MYQIGLPHQSELVNFYEDYFAGKFSSNQTLNKDNVMGKKNQNQFLTPK